MITHACDADYVLDIPLQDSDVDPMRLHLATRREECPRAVMRPTREVIGVEDHNVQRPNRHVVLGYHPPHPPLYTLVRDGCRRRRSGSDPEHPERPNQTT